jgi:hypothetical protein
MAGRRPVGRVTSCLTVPSRATIRDLVGFRARRANHRQDDASEQRRGDGHACRNASELGSGRGLGREQAGGLRQLGAGTSGRVDGRALDVRHVRRLCVDAAHARVRSDHADVRRVRPRLGDEERSRRRVPGPELPGVSAGRLVHPVLGDGPDRLHAGEPARLHALDVVRVRCRRSVRAGQALRPDHHACGAVQSGVQSRQRQHQLPRGAGLQRDRRRHGRVRVG